MARQILHLDLDAFFCAVEEQRNTSLRGKAFAVGGRPEGRGVVASCSYPARVFGIHSAMPMAQAIRRLPHLIVVPANHGAYRAMSRRVMKLLASVTEEIEQLSIDEAFLDTTTLGKPAEILARHVQSTIWERLQLPCSLGVATNKLVAKIANNVGKAAASTEGPPNAVQVVPPGEEAAFLAPLPIDALWGVGPKTASKLNDLGIRSIGDLAKQPVVHMQQRFGKNGADLVLRAQGIDDRPVVRYREPKSISQETTFSKDITQRARLQETLREHSAGVSRQLKRMNLVGATIKLKLRWADFVTPTRQLTIERPTDDAERIYAVALQLFNDLWEDNRPVRLLGVGISNLDAPPRQMSLWGTPDERAEKLAQAVRALRKRYGDDAVMRGSDMAVTTDEDDFD